MVRVATVGQFIFVINTRENDFEPPHVHVWVAREDVCRIELIGAVLGGAAYRNVPGILRAYGLHVEEIRRVWDEIHGR